MVEFLLRLVHVLLGLLWFGLIAFPVLVSGPALATLAPPDKAKAFLAMIQRQTAWAVLSAMGTLLSGVVLFGHMYLESGAGIASSNAQWALLGAVLGLAVFIMGMTRLRPTALLLRQVLLGEQTGDPAALSVRIVKTGRVMFLHLLAAMVCMSLAGHPALEFNALNAFLAILISVGLGLGLLFLVPRLGTSEN